MPDSGGADVLGSLYPNARRDLAEAHGGCAGLLLSMGGGKGARRFARAFGPTHTPRGRPPRRGQVRDGEELVAVAPRRGSVLLFPHATPHMGNCVGSQHKALLRGEML